LFETVLLYLRGSTIPHPALHITQHAGELFMAWAWLKYRTSTMFVGLIATSTVSAFLATGGLLAALKEGYVWRSVNTQRWEECTMILQIARFVATFGSALCTLFIVSFTESVCSGTGSLLLQCILNACLLYQFSLSLRLKQAERDDIGAAGGMPSQPRVPEGVTALPAKGVPELPVVAVGGEKSLDKNAANSTGLTQQRKPAEEAKARPPLAGNPSPTSGTNLAKETAERLRREWAALSKEEREAQEGIEGRMAREVPYGGSVVKL